MSRITVNASDPTESKRKRKRFRQAFGSRWREVRGRNREWIMDRSSLQTGRIQSTYRRFFEGVASENLLGDVSDRQVRRGRHWTGSHITTAYDTGLRIARADMRGLGASEDVVRRATNRSDTGHQTRLTQEYEKVYFKTTDHVSYATTKASDLLREAVENNQGKRAFADAVNEMIRSAVRNRYRLTASTAITRTVNEALVTSFLSAGVTEVGVAVEELGVAGREQAGSVRTNAGELAVETAGDEKVCAECRALAGQRVSIDAVRKRPDFQPPLHPGCRCRLVPTAMEINGAVVEV